MKTIFLLTTTIMFIGLGISRAQKPQLLEPHLDKKNSSLCNCGKWDTKEVNIFSYNYKQEQINCGATLKLDTLQVWSIDTSGFGSSFGGGYGIPIPVYHIPIPRHISITLPKYVCNSSSCEATYQWKMEGPQGTLTGSGNVVSYSIWSNGLFTGTMYATCGGKVCDSCVFKIQIGDIIKLVPDVKDTCKCVSYRPTIFRTDIESDKKDPFSSQQKSLLGTKRPSYKADTLGCGGNYSVMAGDAFSFQTAVICPDKCAPSYSWELRAAGGAYINGGTSNNGLLVAPATAGDYVLLIRSRCGGSSCQNCVFNIKVKEKCKCIGWSVSTNPGGTVITIGQTITLTQQTNINAYYQCSQGCSQAGTRVIIKNSAGVIVQNSPAVGNSFYFNPQPLVAGLYTVTLEGNCTGPEGVTPCSKFTFKVNWAPPPPPVVPHGSWEKGPGNYSFTIGASCTTCNINTTAGQVISLTMQVWGAGGGGGGGGTAGALGAGGGGGGGSGGGYANRVVTVTVPTTGIISYNVIVGAGGLGGSLSNILSTSSGGSSDIIRSGGYGVVFAHGGNWGSTGLDGRGGFGGSVFPSDWSGLAGEAGSNTTSCSGGTGGAGGAGGGPGRINDGGKGGNGGYKRSTIPLCTAQSLNFGRTAGSAGMNGKVVISW